MGHRRDFGGARLSLQAGYGYGNATINMTQTTISPTVDRVLTKFHVALVERRVNERFGGDATIRELLSLMIEMGWQPPLPEGYVRDGR